MKELPPCPVEVSLLVIGDKWKVLILRELRSGTKRFGEIRDSINGISQKVLTEKLREMESDGLVIREAYAEIPPRVEYSLSELGETLGPVLDSLKEWGEMYKRLNAES
ncbi:MAG: helix-turn-helix transcriptional regulator [Thermoplasmata archaeon]|nr:helix-turn-helix transcriptional regulator [Thermoplasmata archaeon]